MCEADVRYLKQELRFGNLLGALPGRATAVAWDPEAVLRVYFAHAGGVGMAEFALDTDTADDDGPSSVATVLAARARAHCRWL